MSMIATLAAHHAIALATVPPPALVHLWTPPASGTTWIDSVNSVAATSVGGTLSSAGSTYDSQSDQLNILEPSLSIDCKAGGDDFAVIVAAHITAAQFASVGSARLISCVDSGQGIDVVWLAALGGYAHRTPAGTFGLLEETPSYPIDRCFVSQRVSGVSTIRWASKSAILSAQTTEAKFNPNPTSNSDSYNRLGIGCWPSAIIERAMPGTIPAFGIASGAITDEQLFAFANEYL